MVHRFYQHLFECVRACVRFGVGVCARVMFVGVFVHGCECVYACLYDYAIE